VCEGVKDRSCEESWESDMDYVNRYCATVIGLVRSHERVTWIDKT
jgi:hypothetical protein